MTLRVLGSLRLSVETDTSTAIPRHRDHIQHWVDAPGHDVRIVAWATDTDVSGGLHPFKRPDLGKWFRDELADQWDVLCVMKVDRLSRRVAHFSDIVQSCQEHGKIIVSTQEGIDMSTPMGKMFAQILAVFAEGELDTIRTPAADNVHGGASMLYMAAAHLAATNSAIKDGTYTEQAGRALFRDLGDLAGVVA